MPATYRGIICVTHHQKCAGPMESDAYAASAPTGEGRGEGVFETKVMSSAAKAPLPPASPARRRVFFLDDVAFARRQEQILFEPMLPRVQVVIPATQRIQARIVFPVPRSGRLPRHGFAPPDGSSTAECADHKRRPPLHQVTQPILNHRLRLRNRATTSPHPESGSAGSPESPSRWTAAAAVRPTVSPALAHDRVVPSGVSLRKLIHARNPACAQELFGPSPPDARTETSCP